MPDLGTERSKTIFQSSRPVGGATRWYPQRDRIQQHFNPRAPWGARPAGRAAHRGQQTISILAPRGGRDRDPAGQSSGLSAISILAPRGGRDSVGLQRYYSGKQFQSSRPVGGATSITAICCCRRRFQSSRPVGGATVARWFSWAVMIYFNPRAPWGARHHQRSRPASVSAISILAPRGGRDSLSLSYTQLNGEFQSSRPVGGATILAAKSSTPESISILAPRGGRDPWGLGRISIRLYFNPRAPWGARQ